MEMGVEIEDDVPYGRTLSDAAFEKEDKRRRRRNRCPFGFEDVAKMKFPCTKINICAVVCILIIPLSIGFSVTYTTFPDYTLRREKLWKWFAFGLMLVGGWVAWYILAGFVCFLMEVFFPRTLFTFYFVELRHTIAVTGLSVLFLFVLEHFLEDAKDKDFLERGAVCFIIVSVLYGLRMVGERYLLLHFARKEYFGPLRKLMFREKIVFKLLQYRVRHEKAKMNVRKKEEERKTKARMQSVFLSSNPNEISPDVKLIESGSITETKLSWVSPTEDAQPPDAFMLHQCEKYSDCRHLNFLNYGKDRKHLFSISNDDFRNKMLDEDIDNITELIFKALKGHHGPITVDSFSVIFPEKPHRREAAFSVMSGGPLDTTIEESDIRATVAHVFQQRHNTSASLERRGDIAKVLSGFTGIFFWSLMLVVVLLIYEVDILTVAVPYLSILLSFSFMFGASIQNMVHSAILILVLHPFDVGDRLTVNDGDPIVVHHFTLYQTVAFKPDGRWVSIPNSKLYNANIINAHRSKSYTIVFKLDVEVTTPPAKLVALINETKALCANHPIYLPDPLITIDSVGDNSNSMEVEFWIETTLIPWYKPDKCLELKTEFILWVSEQLKEKDITYEQPILPVKIQSGFPHSPLK